MSEVHRREFAEAVAAALTSVRHLYRQIHLLNQSLVESLRSTDRPLAPVAQLRGVGKDNDYGRMIIRDSFSTLFQPGVGSDVDEPEDASDLEAGEDRESKRVVEIALDQTTLALSTSIATRTRTEGFEPNICYALIGRWQIDDRPLPHTAGSNIQIRPYMFRRMMLAFPPPTNCTIGRRVYTTARSLKKSSGSPSRTKNAVSFEIISQPVRVPLFDMNSPQAIEHLAEEISQYVAANSDADSVTDSTNSAASIILPASPPRTPSPARRSSARRRT